MSACPMCGAEMRPLLFSEFCPNEDGHEALAKASWAQIAGEDRLELATGFDMTCHVWVARLQRPQLGDQIVLLPGTQLYQNAPFTLKFGPVAVCLSGISGAAIGWLVRASLQPGANLVGYVRAIVERNCP